MFKKLMSFACWAALLCVLFILCFIYTVLTGQSLFMTPVMWLAVVITVLVVRFLWASIAAGLPANIVAAFKKRLKMSRMEYVLSEHWKAGAAVIKRIRRQKKPLPWFVLTGGRSGKTTLMAGAGLPLFSDEPESNVVIPTRTLRWWFFRTAGFLDLSGLFLSKTPAFRRAWLRLVSWCGRVPAPAGIVVCVPASALMEKESADLHLQARHIRTQIEPLIKKVKCRLPVYVFITCCDAIPGFSLWANRLSAAQRQQALGYYWLSAPIVDGKDSAFLDPLFSCIKAGLDNARVSMLSGGEASADTLALLDFPEQFPVLQPALLRYLAALCEPDVYFEPAALGGVWFTATEPVSKNSATRQAFFLHDLMTRVLPDLSLHHKAKPVGCWRRFSRQWGGALLCGLAVCGVLISGAYSHNLLSGDIRAMTVAAQVAQLQSIEEGYNAPLRYLPFLPALHHREGLLEAGILASTPHHRVNVTEVNRRYQQQFDAATPAGRRELILALARTLLLKQDIRDGKPLSALLTHPPEPALLSMTGTDDDVTREHSLALQRIQLQQPDGAAQMAALRQLLVTLVNRDPQWRWLVAPDDRLPPVRMSDFLPSSDSDVTVGGIWTLQGQAQMQRWLADIRAAAGEDNPLPVLDTAQRDWNTFRQTQWMRLILAFNQLPAPAYPADRWQPLLIAIDQGNSPAMLLARTVNAQLADIDEAQAAAWLRQLRQVQHLQTVAGAGAPGQKALRLAQSLRQKVLSLLTFSRASLPQPLSDLSLNNWLAWRSSLHGAVADAFAVPPDSDRLTRGLFRSEETGEANPLPLLSTRFSALRKSLSAAERQDYAIDAVWALYQSDARWLVAHAMQRSGCWLERQWQSRVLWPMEKNAARLDYQAQQDLAWQYLTDFARGPARSVLVMGEDGPQSGKFDGQSVGLTPGFLRLINHVLAPDDVLAMPERKTTRNDDALAALNSEQARLESQLKALEAKPIELTLKSQPATIPGGARLMPVGTTLTLFCDEQSWTLKSMNFSEQAAFRWQPGHCSRVAVEILFPGFTLQYNYVGDSAWPDFLSDIAEGQHRYAAEDFADDAAQLQVLGIRHILVRYQADSQRELQEAWTQWQALNSALENNAGARQAISDKKAEQQRPTALNHAFSQLPAHIATCD